MVIVGFRQILYYKWGTNMKLLKKAGSVPWMLATSMIPGYMLAFWFMARCAMNEPDVSWLRNKHNYATWTMIRPTYQYNLWEPYRDYSKLAVGKDYGPVFELGEEYKERLIGD